MLNWTLGCDANDPHRLADFWAQTLGCTRELGYDNPDSASAIDRSMATDDRSAYGDGDRFALRWPRLVPDPSASQVGNKVRIQLVKTLGPFMVSVCGTVKPRLERVPPSAGRGQASITSIGGEALEFLRSA
jgi:hypothetical protein